MSDRYAEWLADHSLDWLRVANGYHPFINSDEAGDEPEKECQHAPEGPAGWAPIAVAAKARGVGESAVSNWANRGKIPSKKIGRYMYVELAAAMAYKPAAPGWPKRGAA